MKWLQLDTDFRNNPKVKAMMRKFGGLEAAGFWCLLMSYIGANGVPACEIKLDDTGEHSTIELSSYCCTKPKVLLSMLDHAAVIGLITAERWTTDRVISVPNMLKRLDNYTRKLRTKDGQAADSPPHKDNKKTIDNKEKKSPTPFPEKKLAAEPKPPARKDDAYELFVKIHDEARTPAKYRRNMKVDFIQLASVRETHQVEFKGDPPEWERACRNYLASDRGKFSVADLCANYPVFVHNATDRFNKPKANGNGNGKVAGQEVYDHTKKMKTGEEFLAEDGNGSESGNPFV